VVVDHERAVVRAAPSGPIPASHEWRALDLTCQVTACSETCFQSRRAPPEGQSQNISNYAAAWDAAPIYLTSQ
jgi:hypothetical protein